VVHVSIDEAERMTAAALRAIGWDADDAALQAEIMTAAELCGNNQGLVKMYQPHLMAPSPDYAGKPVVTRETVSSAVIDARQSPGMLAAVTAADLVVQKLESTNSNTASSPPPPPTIAIVCTHNSSTSSGQLAFYVERMARRGIIGLALCNSPEFVAAAPGAKPVFGTNPLAVSVPVSGSDYPFTVSSSFAVCVLVALVLT
jgi:LDH2 family malate/lactate/ureidoglycolate dehydrogenase